MDSQAGFLASLVDDLTSSPLKAIVTVAAALALALTPIAFVLLSRRDYLFARRGRVYRKPEWWSVVCSMLLVMGIPAILLAFLAKSDSFDRSRYEFDPNQTFTVLDQGRQFRSTDRIRSLREAREAVRVELKRLIDARQFLQDQVTGLDQSAAGLAGIAAQSPDLTAQIGPVVDTLKALPATVGLETIDPEALLADLDRTDALLKSASEAEAAQIDDSAIRREMGRLAELRKQLVDQVKAIDEQLLPLRAASTQAPALAESLDPVLNRLGVIRRSIGLDAPQQLVKIDDAPVDVRRLVANLGPAPIMVAAAPGSASATPATPPGPGLTPAQREAELAAVPGPQKPLAALLPLTNLPEGWEIGKSGDRYTETFNAENLYEKIDGRAESFLQYDVEGMAYTYFHPAGDDSAEAQLYLFEMSSPLNALGKYGSEKPDEYEPVRLGSDGYASGASIFFQAKKVYGQVVCTSDDPKFKEFALAIARRIAEEIMPGSTDSPSEPAPPAGDVAAASTGSATDTVEEVSPDQIFGLLPASGKANQKYVAQDVFGYSFLSDSFMADYSEADATWQGFVRTYPTPEEARKVLDQYRAESESFGAKITEETIEGADAAILSENFGQFDLLFVKGNTLAGANGATALEPARKFVAEFAKGLPASAPFLPAEAAAPPPGGGGEDY